MSVNGWLLAIVAASHPRWTPTISTMVTHADSRPAGSETTVEGQMQRDESNPLDDRARYSEAEVRLTNTHLNFRADVTRHSPPVLSRIRELYKGGKELSDERAAEIIARTDRRILQAAERHARGEW
jgi:hypothetical protein